MKDFQFVVVQAANLVEACEQMNGLLLDQFRGRAVKVTQLFALQEMKMERIVGTTGTGTIIVNLVAMVVDDTAGEAIEKLIPVQEQLMGNANRLMSESEDNNLTNSGAAAVECKHDFDEVDGEWKCKRCGTSGGIKPWRWSD